MGLLDIFKAPREAVKEEIAEVPWHTLNSLDQLDTLVGESKEKPVAVFKHSTRCGISRAVLKIFERNYTLSEGEVKLYFLDLLQNRDISNEIANRFNVRHESPQLIILKDGAVADHSSHHSIEAATLKKFL